MKMEGSREARGIDSLTAAVVREIPSAPHSTASRLGIFTVQPAPDSGRGLARSARRGVLPGAVHRYARAAPAIEIGLGRAATMILAEAAAPPRARRPGPRRKRRTAAGDGSAFHRPRTDRDLAAVSRSCRTGVISTLAIVPRSRARARRRRSAIGSPVKARMPAARVEHGEFRPMSARPPGPIPGLCVERGIVQRKTQTVAREFTSNSAPESQGLAQAGRRPAVLGARTAAAVRDKAG